MAVSKELFVTTLFCCFHVLQGLPTGYVSPTGSVAFTVKISLRFRSDFIVNFVLASAHNTRSIHLFYRDSLSSICIMVSTLSILNRVEFGGVNEGECTEAVLMVVLLVCGLHHLQLASSTTIDQ